MITSPGRSSLERRMRDWQTQLRVPHRQVLKQVARISAIAASTRFAIPLAVSLC